MIAGCGAGPEFHDLIQRQALNRSIKWGKAIR